MDFNLDTPPNPDFAEAGSQARLAAHYLLTLKEQGLSEHEACELTREWIALCVDAAKNDEDLP